MSSSTLTQTFNGVIFPIVGVILFAVMQHLVRQRVNAGGYHQKAAPWGEDKRNVMKWMCMYSSLFGFFHIFSPMFQSSLLAMAVPMVGT